MLSLVLIVTTIVPAAQPEQRELLETFRQEFVAITPGEGAFPKRFVMGSADGPVASRPDHPVTINHSFSIAKYEVTQELWQAVMGENPSRWKGRRNSVEMLSFDEAVDFCARLTKLLQEAKLIGQDEVVRLPTEAEWEYAARAGTQTAYSFGDSVSDLDAFAWHTGNAAGNDPPVGAKKPNPWGLYDMHGYLWEWCSDAWRPNYDGAPADGTASTDVVGEDSTFAALRSGSWKDRAERLTSSYRRKADKRLRDDAVGLRCVLAKAK